MKSFWMWALVVLVMGLAPVANATETPHNFPMGMYNPVCFQVPSGEPARTLYWEAVVDTLTMIAEGTANLHEACNMIQIYSHPLTSSNQVAFYRTLLEKVQQVKDATGVDLKILVDIRYDFVRNSDGELSSGDLANLDTFINDLLYNNNYKDRIGGWYIADEPSRQGFPADGSGLEMGVNSLYNLIHAINTPGVSEDVYLCEQAYKSGGGDINYAAYNYDVLLVDYYAYAYNSAADGTLQRLNNPLTEAISEAGGRPVHAVIFAGRLQNFLVSHGLLHSAIRKVLDLGVKGIWFYSWPNVYYNGSFSSGDCAINWLEGESYAEAVESEIHDVDYLVSAWSNSSKTSSAVICQTVPSIKYPDGFFYPSIYQQASPYVHVSALAAGDLWGEEGSDTGYTTGSKSNGDGDDEIILAEEGGTSSRAMIGGNNYFSNSAQMCSYTNKKITAMTAGDFDGDGDREVVFAVQDGSNCSIYVSNDGSTVNSTPIYESTYYRVTALTAGDFKGQGRDWLVSAYVNQDNTQSAIYLGDIGSGSGPHGNGGDQGYCLLSDVFGDDNECYRVTAMTTGDFFGNGKDWLVTADTNYWNSDSRLYIGNIGNGTPNILNTLVHGDGSNGGYNGNRIWRMLATNADYVSALAAADFNGIVGGQRDELIVAFAKHDQSQGYTRKNTMSLPVGSDIFNTMGNVCTYDGYVAAMAVGMFTEAKLSETHYKMVAESTSNGEHISTPLTFSLNQNQPNPFNPSTQISFTIPSAENVSLVIYNALGQEVRTLVNEMKPAGRHSVVWDGKDDGGRMMTSGMYFCKITAGKFVDTSKMLLMK